jgi:hypothetical protein
LEAIGLKKLHFSTRLYLLRKNNNKMATKKVIDKIGNIAVSRNLIEKIYILGTANIIPTIKELNLSRKKITMPFVEEIFSKCKKYTNDKSPMLEGRKLRTAHT